MSQEMAPFSSLMAPEAEELVSRAPPISSESFPFRKTASFIVTVSLRAIFFSGCCALKNEAQREADGFPSVGERKV